MTTPTASTSTSSASYLSTRWSASCARRLLHLKSVDVPGRRAAELVACARYPAHWVNQWCWTQDPRDLTVWPFDLFPRQEEFLSWLQEREATQTGGLAEKSRDMGATWLCAAYALHGWLFRPSFAAGFGSRKLELVDRLGDLDSIVEKVRFLLYGLPGWMFPAGFRRADHDNLARLVNPATGGSITGEGGDNIGRGGRKSIYFVDEAAFLDRPDLVERSLSENTRVRVDVSTPNGPGNPFARKRFGGVVPVFTLHWKDDPRKNRAETLPDGRVVHPWYEHKKATLDPVTLAQEIDIDYSASVEGICVPAKWVRAAVGLPLPLPPPDPAGRRPPAPVVAGLDVGEEGPDLSVLMPRRGAQVLPPAWWGKMNTTQTAWKARDEAAARGVVTLLYDVGGPGLGVKGTWQSAERGLVRLPFRAVPVNTGEAPTNAWWPDGRTSKELFLNLRAELWWRLRRRFERTYEYVNGIAAHAPEEMISIPDHAQLIAELSLPLYDRTDTGKIRLESKADMRRRGVKSPDFADALALAFHQPPEMGVPRAVAGPAAPPILDPRRSAGRPAALNPTPHGTPGRRPPFGRR